MSADGFENALKLLIELNSAIEKAKALYQDRDDLVMKMKEAGFKEAKLDGLTFVLRDNFEEKNTMWRAAAMSRFEIRVERCKK